MTSVKKKDERREEDLMEMDKSELLYDFGENLKLQTINYQQLTTQKTATPQ